MSVRVKICCMKNLGEVDLAIRSGATALGFVSAMPSGPGPISEELIAELIARVPPTVSTFLLTSKQDASSIVDQQHRTNPDTLQLVDAVSTNTYRELREELPTVALVQVIHVTGNESLENARSIASFVDGILLDSGNPNLAVKELGGTGRVHNWSISRKICEELKLPVYLAGGLTPDNVAEAIRTVHPFAVDVCSGVRTNGVLDAFKLSRFFDEVRSV
jgi:phosphoribosylanthranilate isomerase